MKMTNILEAIEKDLKTLDMDLQDDSWRNSVPSSPGWYFIETNTPLKVFKILESPPKNTRHYNIPEKVITSLSLKSFEACILPSENPFYFVYSGEAKNLKARAREHVSGHPKTGCLALSNYSLLFKYKWRFYYSECRFTKSPDENKLVRVFGEQMWRAKYGWPILCGK